MNQADSRRRFEADGHVLYIPGPSLSNPQLQCLEDAVLLDAVSPLLQCIDYWAGLSLDWSPASAPEDSKASSSREIIVTLRARRYADGCALEPGAGPSEREVHALAALSDDRTSQGVQFAIDASRLGAMREWPIELDEFVSTRWAERSMQASLCDVDLGSGDTARLGRGALLVLPASFDETMPVRLSGIGFAGQSTWVQVDWRSAELNAAAACMAEQPASSTETRASVTLCSPVRMPVHAWIGGLHRAGPWRQPFDLLSTPLAVTLGSRSWHAEIVRLGDGLGALIGDRMVSAPPT